MSKKQTNRLQSVGLNSLIERKKITHLCILQKYAIGTLDKTAVHNLVFLLDHDNALACLIYHHQTIKYHIIIHYSQCNVTYTDIFRKLK